MSNGYGDKDKWWDDRTPTELTHYIHAQRTGEDQQRLFDPDDEERTWKTAEIGSELTSD